MSVTKEAVIPLLAAIIGGMISPLLTNHGSAQKDFLTERRQKLEVLVTDLYTESTCAIRENAGKTVDADCESDIPAHRSMAYAKLYFPEIYDVVAKYQTSQVNTKLQMLKCMAEQNTSTKFSELQSRYTCLQKTIEFQKQKDADIDAIIGKAREVGLTMAPTKFLGIF